MIVMLIVCVFFASVVINYDLVNAAVAGTWKHDSRGWYYRYSDGSFARNGWIKYGNKWYYFNSKGYMVTGWKKIGGKWYFLDRKSGAMKTGWLKIGGKWYFLDKKTGAMKTGWMKIGGKRYYLDKKSGTMKTGKVMIDGDAYWFDKAGVLKRETKKLEQMETFYENNGSQTAWGSKLYELIIFDDESFSDNTGRDGLYGIAADYSLSDFWYSDESIIYVDYLLKRKYDRLTGDVVLFNDSKSARDRGRVLIYGDNKLLYTSPEITGGIMPKSINVDVKGVNRLRIEFRPVTGNCEMNMTFGVANPILINDL